MIISSGVAILVILSISGVFSAQQGSVVGSLTTKDCLIDAVQCLSQHTDPHKDMNAKITTLETEVANLKSIIASVGRPNGLANLDASGHLLQKFLPAGYDKLSAYDLAWQSLHMAAAAACRGSTPTGGSGCCGNYVLIRNIASRQTCTQICQSKSPATVCDGEVSMYGKPGKGVSNGEQVGHFYNYGCGERNNGGSEASTTNDKIMGMQYGYYSFCCCRQ